MSPQFVVEAVPTFPAWFRPLTDHQLTDALAGLTVRTNQGHVGRVRIAYDLEGVVKAFVVFPEATGLFTLTDLDIEEDISWTPTTSSPTSPTETTAGLSATSPTASESDATKSSTTPSCGCVACVASLLSVIWHD